MIYTPSWLNVRPSRGIAFAIHLVLSILVFSTLVAVMLVWWFPGDLFIMDGGWEGLKLVAMVDLVLGPALTLILFKPGKPGLKTDLSIIAAFQIVALAYGFYTTYNQRTVAVVYADNEFATVSAKDMRAADKELVARDIQPRELPPAKAFSVPQFLTPAYANSGDYLAEVLNGYPVAHHRSDQYVELADHHEQIKANALSIDQLTQASSGEKIKRAINKHALTAEQVEIYPFRARYGNGYALYDPATARVFDFVNIKADKSVNKLAENEP